MSESIWLSDFSASSLVVTAGISSACFVGVALLVDGADDVVSVFPESAPFAVSVEDELPFDACFLLPETEKRTSPPTTMMASADAASVMIFLLESIGMYCW